MKVSKAVVTHNAIVDAARELFMEKSVSKVTVSEITKRAGVAKGTFYVHFESKDELVWHFIDHEIGSVFVWFDGITEIGHEKEDIIKLIDFIIDYVKQREKSLKLMHDFKFFSYLGKQRMEKKFFDDMICPIAVWLEKGKKDCRIDVDDVKFFSYYLTISFHEMIDKILCEEIPFTFDQLGENMKLLLFKILK